jgi:MFS family permease
MCSCRAENRIPKITTQFNALSKISWLGKVDLHTMKLQRRTQRLPLPLSFTNPANGFFITLLAFNLAYSQWLTIFPTKDTLLFAIVVFEAGSLACGAAQSMNVLIFGRALAGLGGSGIFSCNIVLLAEVSLARSTVVAWGADGWNYHELSGREKRSLLYKNGGSGWLSSASALRSLAFSAHS